MQMATEIANDSVSDFDDSEEDQAFMELPAWDDLPAEEVQGDWNPKDKGFVVEMPLKESRINYRVVMESNGLKL